MEEARRQAEIQFVKDLGDANIALATALGDATITHATTTGQAATKYAAAQSKAFEAGDTSQLAQGRLYAIDSAQYQYAAAVQSAEQSRFTNEGFANSDRAYTEGLDAATAAGNRATAEAAYQVAAAQAQRDRLQTIANAANATGQQVFDYQRKAAEVNWLTGLGTAYARHAYDEAYAQEYYRPYFLAKNPPRPQIDPASTPEWVQAENTREEMTAYWEDYYTSNAASAESNRSWNHAYHAGTLAISQAKAAKTQAIDVAKADKTLAVTQAEQRTTNYWGGFDQYDSGPSKQHAEDLAKAALGFATSVEDARLQFQKDETISRGGYSLGLATVQKTRDQNIASTAKTAATSQADYQYHADYLFAVSQESQWSTNTRVDNKVAEQKAIADAAFWTAQESATLSAVQALDTVYNLPWTDFLVAQATTHKDWWGAKDTAGSAAAPQTAPSSVQKRGGMDDLRGVFGCDRPGGCGGAAPARGSQVR